MMDNRKFILMFGGNSDERFVSVASAQNLALTMWEKSRQPFDELWFVSVSGEVTLVTLEELRLHQNPFKNPFLPHGQKIADSLADAISDLRSTNGVADVSVFLGFHGTFGEDGKVQELLEKMGIPFTGSDSNSSHLCFDKTLAKRVVEKKNIPVAPELILTAGKSGFENSLTSFFKKHGKIVVKPIANGSSIGLHIIENENQLKSAFIDILNAKYGNFMAEKFIKGRELTVGIIEKDGKTIALPPSEVILNPGGAFDYDGKYLGRGTTEITPAKISPEECSAAQNVALEAHKALGCFGYSRSDVILQDGVVFFIETNTLPGLTKASFIPQQLEAAGLNVADFVIGQLENGLKRSL